MAVHSGVRGWKAHRSCSEPALAALDHEFVDVGSEAEPRRIGRSL